MFLWSVTWRWLVVTPAHYNVHTRTKSLSKILAADARPRFPSTSFQRDVTRSIYTFFLSFSSFFLFFPSSLSLSLSLSSSFLKKKARDRLNQAPVPLDANPSTELHPSNSAPDDPRSYSRGSSTHRASFSPIVSLLRPSFPGRPRFFFSPFSLPRVSPSVLVSLFLSLSNIHDPRCGHVDGRERTGASRSLRPVRLHRRRLRRATGSPTGTDFPPLVGAIRTCPSIHACAPACQWAPAGPCLSANPTLPGPSRPAVQVPPISSPLGRDRALLHSRASTISPCRR